MEAAAAAEALAAEAEAQKAAAEVGGGLYSCRIQLTRTTRSA
jgi:hypothetical protein